MENHQKEVIRVVLPIFAQPGYWKASLTILVFAMIALAAGGIRIGVVGAENMALDDWIGVGAAAMLFVLFLPMTLAIYGLQCAFDRIERMEKANHVGRASVRQGGCNGGSKEPG